MGESAAQTVKEIEEVRERLDRNLGELQGRLPAPAAVAKRLVGLAVGGGVGGSIFWFVVRRIRSKRKEAAAQESSRAAVASAPVASDEGAPGWQPWVAAGAAVWVLLRMAELRQLRRQTKLLSARA